MFTGIIEEVGTIRSIVRNSRSAILTVNCQKILDGTKIGDSIALNGICLTVTSVRRGEYTADVMSETMNRTNLSCLRSGSRVNLERAMAADGRFGGHIVSGHIDGTGEIVEIREDENAVWYRVKTDKKLLRYIVEKGSITVNGISLTVVSVDDDSFQISIIPHTRQETNLTEYQTGDTVNLECDILAKYVEKLLGYAKNDADAASISQEATGKFTAGGSSGKITEAFLREYGF